MRRARGPAERADREIDAATLARAQAGDREALRSLVAHYEQQVFSLLSRVLRIGWKEAPVEDLAQETFLRAFRALPRFRPEGPARFSTWLLTIATRLAIDAIRKRRAPPDPPQERHSAMGPTDQLVLAISIERAVAGLPAEFRVAFVLRAFHEFDYAEIADALGVSIGTVKSRLSRAKAALRTALSEVEDE